MKTCPHLAPLEDELAVHGIPLGDASRNPYSEEFGLWCLATAYSTIRLCTIGSICPIA
jgi:hypothetical protein